MPDQNPYHPFKPPFRADEHGMIFDANNNHFANLRGWGFLTRRGGGMAIPFCKAEKIHDNIAKRIANLLNEDANKKDLQLNNIHEG